MSVFCCAAMVRLVFIVVDRLLLEMDLNEICAITVGGARNLNA